MKCHLEDIIFLLREPRAKPLQYLNAPYFVFKFSALLRKLIRSHLLRGGSEEGELIFIKCATSSSIS